MTQNAIPAFVDYVKTHTSAVHADSLLSNPSNVANTKELTQLANQFVTSAEGKQLMSSAVDQTVTSHIPSSKSFSQSSHQKSDVLFRASEKTVNQSITDDRGLVKSVEAKSDTTYRGWKGYTTEKAAEGFIHLDQKKINHQHQTIKQTGNYTVQQTQGEIQQISRISSKGEKKK